MTPSMRQKSAPECLLSKAGTPISQAILLAGVQDCSDTSIKALETELSFYAETGLIGVQMSRLLGSLDHSVSAEAA